MAPHVKSKRTTLKHKYKVEKKVRQHQREVRRSNKNKPEIRKIKRKDPGIPNLWPFKQQLMEQMERKKSQEAEAKKVALEARREAVRAARASGIDPSIAEIVAKANESQSKYESRKEAESNVNSAENATPDHPDNSKRAFMKEFKKVIESSDVILEVLDARDPMGCRCYDAERAILASSGGLKRIVLVLTKVDMVPKEVADKWLSYLRNEYPTIAFRSSLQESRDKGQVEMSALAAPDVNVSGCLGANNLLSLLKNYSRRRNIKTSIAVGVIGFPNVGKSSLINSLKRSRAVASGSTPGLTRNAQEVHLDKNIRLIDCPGIVFSACQSDALVLRNCLKIEQLYDPVSPVETIIKRVGSEPLMLAYGVPQFDTITEFLAFLCSARGKYRRGGAFDVEAAARIVLHDWNSGKIPFYTLPPTGPRQAHLSASVVEKWSTEFDINSVLGPETEELQAMRIDPKRQAQFAIATPGTGDGGIEIRSSCVGLEGGDNTEKEASFHVANENQLGKRAMKRGLHTEGAMNE